MGSLRTIGGPASLLRQPLSFVNGLRPLPWLERLMMRRTFKREGMRLGPSQKWLARYWDIRLAYVNGTIYKIALEARASDKNDAVDLTTSVMSVLQKVLGTPTKQGDALFLWDADDGNAVLQLANVGGERRVMVFFTSSIARTFVPR